MKALGTFAVARRRWILLATIVGVVLAGGFGGSVASHLSSGGFTDPRAESSKASDTLDSLFHTGTPNLLLLVTAKPGSVNDPAVAAEGVALTNELGAQPGVSNAVSYWTLGEAQPLRSNSGSQAVVLARITGTDDQIRDRVKTLSPMFTRHDALISVRVGGSAEVFRQVSAQVEKDLRRAETISLPVTLLLLILIFGSVVAAGLPLGIGVVAIIGTFFVLRVLAAFTSVSIFSLNLTTPWASGWPSTTACSSCLGSVRSCERGSNHTPRSSDRCRPPAGPCCSAR
jgi:RND superfamily putative drug exporter